MLRHHLDLQLVWHVATAAHLAVHFPPQAQAVSVRAADLAGWGPMARAKEQLELVSKRSAEQARLRVLATESSGQLAPRERAFLAELGSRAESALAALK